MSDKPYGWDRQFIELENGEMCTTVTFNGKTLQVTFPKAMAEQFSNPKCTCGIVPVEDAQTVFISGVDDCPVHGFGGSVYWEDIYEVVEETPPAMDQWQPMETAPKGDEEYILMLSVSECTEPICNDNGEVIDYQLVLDTDINIVSWGSLGGHYDIAARFGWGVKGSYDSEWDAMFEIENPVAWMPIPNPDQDKIKKVTAKFQNAVLRKDFEKKGS